MKATDKQKDNKDLSKDNKIQENKNEFSSKLFPVSLGEEILNFFGEYFFSSFGNKLHISLYFPLLFVPIKISLILLILY